MIKELKDILIKVDTHENVWVKRNVLSIQLNGNFKIYLLL